MKKLILLLLIFFLFSCRALVDDNENEATQAQDTYPFTERSKVYRWEKNRIIRVKLPADGDVSIVGYNSGLRVIVNDAIDTWNGVLEELNIKILITDNGTNDVEVQWHDGSGLGGAVGIARYDPTRNPSRYIILTTRQSNGVGHTNRTLETIAIHELGHILGIWSHSFSPNDIMYPLLTDTASLSTRDLATLRQAYSVPIDVNFHALPPNSLKNGELERFIADNPAYNFKMDFHCSLNKDHSTDHSRFTFENFKHE